ncbi:uncharacterized protein BJ171DRAFT_588782 [Polychytrium aggregatum]|uniref:uncharacterized protein n=1 Tax=Polychytrium aggregatum TaxID=110093 RepID=UPI0022FE5348|nr:uncharacterized protein BJ171DRAFT_588782 [Polychytrium aggregatum]KAI9193227.1 hypothetical protein BJ171DRAFT_588782 [Polychytrium aggregatum]
MIDQLPVEITAEILRYLGFATHQRLRATCRMLARIVEGLPRQQGYISRYRTLPELSDRLPHLIHELLSKQCLPSVQDGPWLHLALLSPHISWHQPGNGWPSAAWSAPDGCGAASLVPLLSNHSLHEHRLYVLFKIQRFKVPPANDPESESEPEPEPEPAAESETKPGADTKSEPDAAANRTSIDHAQKQTPLPRLSPPKAPPLTRLRISVRLLFGTGLRLDRGLYIISEGIRAPMGDCTSVWLRPENRPIRNVYNTPDWGGDPVMRKQLGQDRHSTHLRAFMEERSQVELRYRGGGSDAFLNETFSLLRSPEGDLHQSDSKSWIQMVCRNTERIDTAEILPAASLSQDHHGAVRSSRSGHLHHEFGAHAEEKALALVKWFTDLATRLLDETNAAPHENLARHKFALRRKR